VDAPPFHLSVKAHRTGEQPINHLMHQAVTRPELISLAAGLVDYDSLPVEAVRTCAASLLGDASSGQAALQYGTTEGLAELRDAMLGRLESLDGVTRAEMNLTTEQVVITTGSQQGLYLLAVAMLDPGDIVIASAPDYFVYTHALCSFAADVRSVPVDDDGMRIDELERLLEELASTGELERLKFIYVVSSFQNPTGISLSADRRARLVELARTYSRTRRILVIDDAAYRELRYDGPDTPSIKSYDRDNRYVALAMTFSKAFSPGMKTGCLMLPDELVKPVLWQKGNHDFGSQNLGQHLLYEAMRTGAYARQVERLIAVYRAKRDVMLEALDAHLSDIDGVRWVRPKGGLYVWLTLPTGWDAGPGSELFQRCLDKGVMYVPGAYAYAADGENPVPAHEIRLSFGVASRTAITEGVRRLGAAVREQAAGAPSTGASSTGGNVGSVTAP
jgi:2-aminoadipate transaminase